MPDTILDKVSRYPVEPPLAYSDYDERGADYRSSRLG